MNTYNEKEFFEAVRTHAPKPLSDRELASRYDYLMDDIRETLLPKKAPLLQQAARTVFDAVIRISAKAGHMQTSLAQGLQVIGGAATHLAPAFAHVRGTDRVPVKPETSCTFEKPGTRCSVQANLEMKDRQLNLSLRLADPGGKEIRPFWASITDETGTLLMKNQVFRQGTARINGLEPGEYAIELQAQDAACSLHLQVNA